MCKGSRESRTRRWGCSATLIYMASALLGLAWLLWGCSPTRHVPVETVRTEYKDREIEKLLTDTVRDTRFVFVKGDTVIDWRDRWHTQREYIRDTCFVERVDTVSVPYPVEKKLTRWERTKMDFGGFALGGFAAALCIAVAWLVKKFRR